MIERGSEAMRARASNVLRQDRALVRVALASASGAPAVGAGSTGEAGHWLPVSSGFGSYPAARTASAKRENRSTCWSSVRSEGSDCTDSTRWVAPTSE